MSATPTIDMTGSPFAVAPLATHIFARSKDDDYYCRHCRKPRALHLRDGFLSTALYSNFQSRPPRTTLSTLPDARYRGAHPRWTRPGQYTRPERGDADFKARPPASPSRRPEVTTGAL